MGVWYSESTMHEDLEKFLRVYQISGADFERANLRWDELLAIRSDYKSITKELNLIARYIEDKLQALDVVHSVRCRVKNPDHLIAKIIRKRIASPSRKITIENYRSMITDLVGIRAIHLFKEDWIYIHQFIESTWRLYETPIAYIRAGDAGPHVEEYKRYEFNIEPHPYGYRSIHYLVESKPSRDLYIAEIQVRTIFEEGWSEIDHTIKYPKSVADPLLDTFLDNFNILAGNSDQMGSFVRQLKADLVKGSKKLEMYEKLTEKHAGIIDTLKKRIQGTLGELHAKLQHVEKMMNILTSRGVDATPFERVFYQTRDAVSRFEQELAGNPQEATALYEYSLRELERIESLLGMMLSNTEHIHDHRNGRINVSVYKDCASRFAHNLHTMRDIEPELGEDISRLSPTQDDSHSRVEQAINAIRSRPSLVKRLVGPQLKDVNVLLNEVRVNKEKLDELSAITERVQDPATQYVLWTQINLFEEQNEHLRSFVLDETKRTSLFGWMFKTFLRSHTLDS